MTDPSRFPPHRVVVLLVPPVIGYDATIPPQVFGSARDSEGRQLYATHLASVDGSPTETTSGYLLTPHGDASLLETADTVIVPGTPFRGAGDGSALAPGLRSALDRIRPGARMVSICTGAFVLAEAGLLDGRRATTHWKYTDDLRRRHPRVQVDPDVLFVDSGDVLTSAGLSAGVDLCLHLVRLDHGAEVANAVARHLVVPPWRDGGQAQFIDMPTAERADQSTAATRAWALEHLDDDLTVAVLARQARMPVRTFTRRFTAETAQAPGQWLTQQRVRLAQRLLETSDLPIEQVATRSGLGSAGSLRAHLRSVAGVSPSAYRRTFRGTVPAQS